jgi:hypothetical protein
MRQRLTIRVAIVSLIVLGTLLLPVIAEAEPGFTATRTMPPILDANRGGLDLYGAVSCPSPSTCTAVGPSSLFSFGLLQHRGAPSVVTETNGAWGRRTALPFPGGGQRSAVNGIECAMVGNCVAVGGYTDVFSKYALPLVETEASGVWTESTVALPKGNLGSGQLVSVWCGSIGNCVALGAYSYSTSSSVAPLPMVAVEKSGTWGQAVSLSDGGGTSVIIPTSLSCSDLADCTAIAYGNSTALGAGTFSWRESAGTWSGVALLPQRPGFQFISYSIACPSASTCMAVGGLTKGAGGDIPAVATASSGSWSLPRRLALPRLSPIPTQALFTSVACASSTLCETVGFIVSSSSRIADVPVAATWNGGAWSSLGTFHRSTVGARPAAQSLFDAVACPSTTECLAVGDDQLSADPGSPSSAFSTWLTPTRAVSTPAPPLAVDVHPASRFVDVAWAPPGNDGGSPVTSFTATVVPGGEQCHTARFGCRIGGLREGRRYRVFVRDTTLAGSSLAKASPTFSATVTSLVARRAR